MCVNLLHSVQSSLLRALSAWAFGNLQGQRFYNSSWGIIVLIVGKKIITYPVGTFLVSRYGCCVSFSHEACFCLRGNLLYIMEGSRKVCPKLPLLQAEQGRVPQTLHTGPGPQPHNRLGGILQGFCCCF